MLPQVHHNINLPALLNFGSYFPQVFIVEIQVSVIETTGADKLHASLDVSRRYVRLQQGVLVEDVLQFFPVSLQSVLQEFDPALLQDLPHQVTVFFL